MEINEKLFKALANQTRLDILRWLKDPLTHIDVVTCETVQYELDHFGGICVGDIGWPGPINDFVVLSHARRGGVTHLQPARQVDLLPA